MVAKLLLRNRRDGAYPKFDPAKHSEASKPHGREWLTQH